MSEIFGEDFFLEFFRVFDEDFVITKPGEVFLMLFFLGLKIKYFKDVVKFHDEFGDALLVLFELRKERIHEILVRQMT